MTLNCSTINLKKGSSGNEVVELQNLLKNKGYYQYDVDGIFGVYTEQAVKHLQKVQGNSADGVFGPKTCKKLQNNDNINKGVNKYSKDMMKDMSTRIQKFIKENKRCPNYINAKTIDGRTVQLQKPNYAGLFEARNRFILNNGYEPNYVSEINTANNPLIVDYQDTSYTCGPASVAMGIQYLYGYVSEQQLQKLCNTVKGDGTSPSNLVNGTKKAGYTLQQINRSIKDVKQSIDEYNPVVAHIDTIKASCLNYSTRKNFGHYILIFGVDGTRFKVADPLRGVRTVNASCIINAQYGRSINFYRLKL